MDPIINLITNNTLYKILENDLKKDIFETARESFLNVTNRPLLKEL